MPNKNYLAGRRFEYYIKKYYEHMHYKVLRTAGSHGEFDLVAYRRHAPVVMIQCKVVKTGHDLNRLIADFRNYPPVAPGAAEFQQVLAYKIRETKSWGTIAL